jgi:PAS domain S-box-containing protein
MLLINAVPAGPNGPGVVLVVLRMGSFGATRADPLTSVLSARLVDAGTAQALFDNFPVSTRPVYESHFDFGTRRYVVQTAPSAVYLAQHRRWQSWAVLAAGIFGTGLLGALLLLGTGQAHRFQTIAGRLRESEARLTAILEQLPLGVALIDARGRFTVRNTALERRVGKDVESRDQVARWRWRAVDKDGRLLDPSQWPSARALRGQTVVPGIDFLHTSEDGRETWLRVSAAPFRHEGGELRGAVAVIQDIDAEKRAEEHQRLLMREINHRAKNMLALVDAMARMTVAKSPSDFIERFAERIQALAASQDLLVKSEWKGVELGALLRSQLAHFEDLLDRRILLLGPSAKVTAAAAQAIGLAVHELATNAGKHGALSNETGRVEVAWFFGESPRNFEIVWLERGGPPINKPARKGFGSRVIVDMVMDSLNAKVRLDYPESGVEWRLECAIEKVLEGGAPAPEPATAPALIEASSTSVAGKRVLVVEDEALIAIAVADLLRNAGFEVVGPVGTVARALALIEETGCDVAVLDVNLGDETAEPIARRLIGSGTPFVAVSGYARDQQPEVFRSAPQLAKPVRRALLVEILMQCLEPA